MGLNIKEGDQVIDCTFGRGGHTTRILGLTGKTGKVLGVDRDIDAIKWGEDNFKDELESGQLELGHMNFSQIKAYTKDRSMIGMIQGICADIGVSSPQLDNADRGFSFQNEGPLDMRMDQTQILDAKEVINNYNEEELADLFYYHGDEPKSRYYARKICERRYEKPFTTTLDLADFIKAISPYKTKSQKHPATKIFQAIRVEVNQELKELEVLIQDSFDILKTGGRLGIITFHSLEDRIVKKEFKSLAGKTNPDPALRHLPITSNTQFRGKICKPFPITPSKEELDTNPRSRSAKLRIIEKIN